MAHWHAMLSSTVFIAVIGLIMTEWINLTVAALLGALLLVFTNVMTLEEAIGYIAKSHGTLALFFGVMILVRAFEATKVFDYLAMQILLLVKGEGKRLLLGIVALTAPICAFLPNATTVMLLAPLIPPIAKELSVNFVPLLILMVFVANSAGLLTSVGDPVTFLVSDAVNLSFADYFSRLSLVGVISIAVVTVTLPILFRKTWRTKLDNLKYLPNPQIKHPEALTMGGMIFAFVLVFFVIGDLFPIPISPAAVALLGAALAMLVSHHSKIDTVNNILRDIDWSTLIFFMSTFVLIGGLEKTGVIKGFATILATTIGQNIIFGSIVLLIITGILSSIVPNIPLVVAMIPLLKQYLVNVGLVGTEILTPDFQGQLPLSVLPLFYAMLFGASLGGNGTLVGASSNIVAAGIAQQYGRRISFKGFLKYSIPITVLQLIAATIYLLIRFYG
ncbi:MAG: anion permease [Rivularia sp. (in: Bacteria)]|nr:anion permease [Rivularia sp. MS3]